MRIVLFPYVGSENAEEMLGLGVPFVIHLSGHWTDMPDWGAGAAEVLCSLSSHVRMQRKLGTPNKADSPGKDSRDPDITVEIAWLTCLADQRHWVHSGDHTVKLVCCRTGACVRVLTGHRRTPWVVSFHPRSSALLASGSLDYEVRLHVAAWHAGRNVSATGGSAVRVETKKVYASFSAEAIIPVHHAVGLNLSAPEETNQAPAQLRVSASLAAQVAVCCHRAFAWSVAQVRLWDVPSGVCLATHSFQKPIASLAFHCDGEHHLLAVASGHKVPATNLRCLCAVCPANPPACVQVERSSVGPALPPMAMQWLCGRGR